MQMGFALLDALTGPGVPLNAITLLSGLMTSSELTVAYKRLASAQVATQRIGGGYTVAVLDLTQSADTNYLRRCGVDLNYIFLIRPTTKTEIVPQQMPVACGCGTARVCRPQQRDGVAVEGGEP